MKFIVILVLIIATAMSQGVDLIDQDFLNGVVTDSQGITTGAWFIEFYNPSCPHCKKFAPTWESFTTSYSGQGVNFGRVDCIAYRSTCSRFGVWGVPTMMFFYGNTVGEYLGHNDYESLSSFLVNSEFNNRSKFDKWPVPVAKR